VRRDAGRERRDAAYYAVAADDDAICFGTTDRLQLYSHASCDSQT